MFKRSSTSRPMPAQPSAATSDVNYLSAQVQQLMALVLPEPVVTVLSTISDALYHAVLGKPNEPATYTSTLVPPIMLVLVTYLSVLLAYRTVKSFFSFIIFSIKWFVILAVLVVVVAYSLGNGNLEQGARVAAERGGLDLKNSGGWFDALRKSPASQQVAPYLSQAGNNLGGMAAALPYVQGISQQVFGMMGATGEAASRDRNTREYRDVRPRKKRYSFGEGNNNGPSKAGGMVGSFTNEEAKRRASAPVKRGSSPQGAPADSTVDRIARFMGAKY